MIGAPPPLEGPKVTLDQASFRALASDVRVEVLKKLDERRMTVTDLSNVMTLSKPTLLEHLERLQTADLVRRVDEGRKWIYYELTGKGKKILHPERVTIVVSLCLAVLLMGAGMLVLSLGFSAALYAPGPSGAGAVAMSGGVDPELAIGFGLVASSLWFVALVIYFRMRGDRRRTQLFASLGNL